MSYKSNTVFELIRPELPEHHPTGYWSKTIEVHPISYRIPEYHCSRSDREYFSVIKNGIMSSSDSKVVVDRKSDLPSAKEPILFLSFLFLQTDLLLEVRILVDLFQSRSKSRRPAFQNSNNQYPELTAMILIHPLNRPSRLL